MPNDIFTPKRLSADGGVDVAGQLHALDAGLTRGPDCTVPPVDPRNSAALRFLMDMQLPVTISFGKARMPLGEVVRLETGSVIPLDRGADDPIDVLVNGAVIARGRVVSVDGCYGVEIEETVGDYAAFSQQTPGKGPMSMGMTAGTGNNSD